MASYMSPLRERLLASTAASPLTSSERPSAASTTSLSSPYRGNSYISSQHQQPLLQHQRARLSRSLRSARSGQTCIRFGSQTNLFTVVSYLARSYARGTTGPFVSFYRASSFA
ncbi:hypothetical protein BASA83_012144 [Batrachochytrium salamandrivorans]|nr:hypothetical protein BASA83_012144 [Batrachochytrium salamandrivorans]